MTVGATTRRYPGISAKAYEHPADRAATAALGSIPLLDRVLKRLSELRFERAFEQLLLADAIRIDDRQLPWVAELHAETAAVLDLPAVPELFISRMTSPNAMTIGSARPKILLDPSLVKREQAAGLEAILGHEDGHVLSDHVHYATVLAILQQISTAGGASVARLPLQTVLLVLLEWHRCTELSCDRAAALACDDPLQVCGALMGIAGGNVAGLDFDAFLRQATEYDETEDVLSRPGRWLTELGRTHPYTVRRVAELMRWVREGEFDRIRSGSYLRRGEEPPPSEQLSAATEHYRQRFTEVLDRVSGGVQRLSSQIAAWLRGDSEDDEL